MMKLFDIINIPLAYVLRFFASAMNGNFAAAVFLFTLLIDVVLIPLSIKSQKSQVQQMRMKPKLDEIRKKYGDDRQKLAEAQQNLYQSEGVSMSGGCLPMFIRLALLMSIYNLIMRPLTYLMNIDSKIINAATKALELKDARGGGELQIINAVRTGEYESAEILEGLKTIDFQLFGKINLTQTPEFSVNIFKDFQLIWLIPICAFLAQLLTSLVTTWINKRNNPDTPSMMGMMLTMPLISLFIGFGLPGGVGFYWICSSLIGGAIQCGIQVFYGPHRLLAHERAKEILKQNEFEDKQLKKFQSPDTEE